MAKIQFLTILLTVTCFLGGVVSVTDKEFQDLVSFVYQKTATLEKQTEKQSIILKEQMAKLQQQSVTIEHQTDLIQDLRKENRVMIEEMKRQNTIIEKLNLRENCDVSDNVFRNEKDLVQNDTLEERVALLENQVTVIQDDVIDLEVNLVELEGDVNFLFDEQVIQDERLLNLEETSDGIIGELDLIGDDVEDLLATTVALDFRVTVLEENGGCDGNSNSSVAELEVRVETLEGTAADHETRILAVEADVNDLEETVANHETRLTATEENIQDTIAFHAVLTSYNSIPTGTPVEFDVVLLNEGDGYDNTTGTFNGYYYFSTYLLGSYGEYNIFDLEINGDVLCSVNLDQQTTFGDYLQATCSAAVYATAGDTVEVVFISGRDGSPLAITASHYHNGFTGFRI